MSSTATFYATKSALTKEDTPTYNDHASASVTLDYGVYGAAGNKSLYLGFDISGLENKKINALYLRIAAKANSQSIEAYGKAYGVITGDFNESTVTSGSKPLEYEWLSPAFDFGIEVSAYEYSVINFAQSIIGHKAIRICGEAGQYQGQANVIAYTSRDTEKKSYVKANYEQYYITTNKAQMGWVDRTKPCTFTWVNQPAGANVYQPATPASAVLRYRVSGQTQYTEINATTTTSVTIPANTFSAENYEWNVVVTDTAGNASTDEGWFAFSTADSTSNAVCVSPVNAYVETAEPIDFEWSHVTTTGLLPTGYDVQYKLQSADTWTDMASATDTSATSYTMAANTLSGGKYQWRVRTLNRDGNAGNWSNPANFTARGAPLAPFVQTTSYAASRPTITWTSTGQVGFKMMIYSSTGKLEYDSGEVASAERQHKVNAYLGNGSHIMRLYVINEYGIKSATSEVTLAIAFSAPVAPTVAGEAVAGGAKVTVTGQYSKIYILRDGVPIAKTAGTYIDYMSVGSHQYIARGVDASDNFADSDPVTVETVITTSCIANVDAPSTMAALRLTRDNPERIGYGFARQAIAFQFSGRKLPVYEFGEAETNNYTLNYIVRSKGDFETLRNIVTGRTAVYRTASERHYVVVTEISATKDNIGTDYTLIATETDYKERIDYD